MFPSFEFENLTTNAAFFVPISDFVGLKQASMSRNNDKGKMSRGPRPPPGRPPQQQPPPPPRNHPPSPGGDLGGGHHGRRRVVAAPPPRPPPSNHLQTNTIIGNSKDANDDVGRRGRHHHHPPTSSASSRHHHPSQAGGAIGHNNNKVGSNVAAAAAADARETSFEQHTSTATDSNWDYISSSTDPSSETSPLLGGGLCDYQSAADEEIQRLQAELARLKTAFAQDKSQLQTEFETRLQNMKTKHQAELAAVAQDKSQLQTELETRLRNEKTKHQAELARYEAQLAQAESNAHQYLEGMTKNSREVLDLKSEKRDLSNQVSELKRQAALDENELSQLKSQLRFLEDRNATSESALQDFGKSIGKLLQREPYKAIDCVGNSTTGNGTGDDASNGATGNGTGDGDNGNRTTGASGNGTGDDDNGSTGHGDNAAAATTGTEDHTGGEDSQNRGSADLGSQNDIQETSPNENAQKRRTRSNSTSNCTNNSTNDDNGGAAKKRKTSKKNVLGYKPAFTDFAKYFKHKYPNKNIPNQQTLRTQVYSKNEKSKKVIAFLEQAGLDSNKNSIVFRDLCAIVYATWKNQPEITTLYGPIILPDELLAELGWVYSKDSVPYDETLHEKLLDENEDVTRDDYPWKEWGTVTT